MKRKTAKEILADSFHELAEVCENSLPLPMRPFMLENETI